MTARLAFAMGKMASSQGVEADYWTAIVKIMNSSAADSGKQKSSRENALSQASVAKAAGHSRTPISGENCKFPDVRDFLKPSLQTPSDEIAGGEKSTNADGTSLTDIIRNLRTALAAVRLERDIFATRVVEAENIVAIRDREIQKMKRRPV